MAEDLARVWYGAIHDASDAGEREIPEPEQLDKLQKAMLRILIRQDLCDALSLLICRAEGIGRAAAHAVWEKMYSELMEDAIAGIWSQEDELALMRFMGLCAEGIGDTETYCAYLLRALGSEDESLRDVSDPIAVRVKKAADKHLNAFFVARKAQYDAKRPRRDDDPPPGLDEFEYIDWVITH